MSIGIYIFSFENECLKRTCVFILKKVLFKIWSPTDSIGKVQYYQWKTRQPVENL